jgi:hypothetical protein
MSAIQSTAAFVGNLVFFWIPIALIWCILFLWLLLSPRQYLPTIIDVGRHIRSLYTTGHLYGHNSTYRRYFEVFPIRE